MSKLRLIIQSRRLYFPTLRLPLIGVSVTLPVDFSLRLPSVAGLNLGSHTRSLIGLTLVVSALVISAAIYFAIRGLDPALVWPDTGSYDAAQAQRLGREHLVDGADIPADETLGTQTLQLNIGSARIESIVFSNMDIGKASGLTDSIAISSSSGNILCETLEFVDVEATDFTLATSTVYSLEISTTTADGLSISPTLSADPIKYHFGSTRGALNVPEVSGGTFDRVLISSSSTSTVGLISFRRVKAYGAGISVSNIHCGTVIIRGTSLEESVYGDGSGINTASFTVSDTVKIQGSILTTTIEKPVSVK